MIRRILVKILSSNSIKYAFVWLALSGFLANCANGQINSNQGEKKQLTSSADLSTQEGVLAELQKIKDANIKTTGDEKLDAKIKNARKLETKDVCIERLKESKQIIVIGAFRYDYGCHFEGAFVGSRFIEADESKIHQAALGVLGWKTASQNERENLAKIWVEKGLLAFSNVLYTKDEDFNGADFQPPKTVSNEIGEVSVSLWISVVRRKKEFRYHEFRFAEDGSLLAS